MIQTIYLGSALQNNCTDKFQKFPGMLLWQRLQWTGISLKRYKKGLQMCMFSEEFSNNLKSGYQPSKNAFVSRHKKWSFPLRFLQWGFLRRKLRIWSHLPTKLLIANFVFCAVYGCFCLLCSYLNIRRDP